MNKLPAGAQQPESRKDCFSPGDFLTLVTCVRTVRGKPLLLDSRALIGL